MAISTTITRYISNIDIKYPVAGQDNNSQGFRSNFGNIQAALTATYAVVADLDDRVTTLDHRVGAITNQNIRAEIVTGTNVVQALDQLIVGTTNVLTVSDNFYTRVSMDGAGAGGIKAAGNIALLHNTVVHNAFDAKQDTSLLYLDSVTGILPGSTFTIKGNNSTCTSVDSVNKTISFAPPINPKLFNVGDPAVSVTFNNPFPAGQYDVQTSIHNLENLVNGGHVSSAGSIVNTGGWSMIPDGTLLKFSYNGTVVATLDNLGNFTSVGDIAAGGTL